MLFPRFGCFVPTAIRSQSRIDLNPTGFEGHISLKWTIFLALSLQLGVKGGVTKAFSSEACPGMNRGGCQFAWRKRVK